MEKFELRRIKQCAKCPWRVNTNPNKIPNGYSKEKHEALSCTISKGGFTSTRAMACHESQVGREDYCIGWLHNQLGPGNNIWLRFRFMNCTNVSKIRLIGEQHSRFEDTLPKH
ncbi:DUF6283 family protein [Chitinophaga nivalis]